jgi:hypothetical protein
MHALPLCEDRAGEWYDHPDFDIWAGGNELSVEAECSLLVLPLGTAPGDVKEDFLVFRGLSSESAADCFALSSQERITLFACFCGALKRGSRCLFSGLHSQARGASVVMSGIR